MEISQQFLKVWVGGNTLQFFLRYGLQNDPRIVRQIPELRVDALPKPVRRVIERPSQVQSQIGKSIRDGCIGGNDQRMLSCS